MSYCQGRESAQVNQMPNKHASDQGNAAIKLTELDELVQLAFLVTKVTIKWSWL